MSSKSNNLSKFSTLISQKVWLYLPAVLFSSNRTMKLVVGVGISANGSSRTRVAVIRQKLQHRWKVKGAVGESQQEIGVVSGGVAKDIRHSVKDLDLRVYQTGIRGQSHQSNHIQVNAVVFFFILNQFANHFSDFFVLLLVLNETGRVDDGQRERDLEFLIVINVIDGDAIRLRGSFMNQLKAKRVVTLDVEDVVDHGVDQCRFAGSGDAHQQNRLMFTTS